MQTLSRHSHVLAFAAMALGIGLLLGYAGWPQDGRPFALAALVAASMLSSVLTVRPTGDGRAAMPLSFVVDFAALLLLGPNAASLVAASGAIAEGLSSPPRLHPRLSTAGHVAALVAAIQAGGAAHGALSGTLGHFVWPWQAVPIGGAVVVYCFTRMVAGEITEALVARRPLHRSRLGGSLHVWPTYFVGAGLSVGLVEVVDHTVWELVPAVAVPLYFAYKGYRDHLHGSEDEQRRREVVNFLQEGICVVDHNGRVTLWNDALERLVSCSRDRALGRPLASAVPVVSASELPRAIGEATTTQAPQMLRHLELPFAGGARVFEVQLIPVPGGVSLLWRDVTDRTRAEHDLKRHEERLALAAEGANDGLWEWDLRTQEFYVSGRWRAMLGVDAPAATVRPDEWIARVHVDDVLALKEALEAHLSGATDFFQHEHRIRHEDGSYRRFLCRGVATRSGRRRAMRIAGSLTDTTERAIAQERLRSVGVLDPLTGLCNRAVFVERLGRRLDTLKQRRGTERFAVLYLDLDRFKVVNDSLGHLVGDELLIAVSRRLEGCLRPDDAIARLGGDEFAILLNALADEGQANVIAFRIQEALSAPFSIGGREVFTSASIGIAPGLAHYATPDEIMRDADTAMYHAKSRGKARHELFDADMHARARDRLGLENDLRHAVNSNDFEVHYQPIVSLASGMCVGFESLVRWNRNGVLISPATFIPIAEELGVIEPLGNWVLHQACTTFADWQRRFASAGLDCITVNVSSRQLMQPNFLNIVEQAVHKSGLRPCDLRIEITETALMDSPHVAAEVLRELRNFGVKIYLDDFGTGYSSLSHLHKLPVDALKIDRSFVKSLLLPDRPAIVESILALARTLNTSVVAEGIESDQQARQLERLGCTHAQGYLFSRPLSTLSVEQLLQANRPLGPKQALAAAGEAVESADPQLYYSSVPFEWPTDVPA